MATASITPVGARLVLAGHGLTPGAKAAAIFFAGGKTTQANLSGGVIGAQYAVDADGTVTIRPSRQQVTGGASGRVIAALATDAGELVSATVEV